MNDDYLTVCSWLEFRGTLLMGVDLLDMSDDTVRPDEYNDETNRICSTNVHCNKLHSLSEPENNQPSRLLIAVQDMHAE